MKLETARISEKRAITSDMWTIRLHSPQIAREARAGQFVHVRLTPQMDPLLRRPMSIYRIRDDGIELLIRPLGRGSRMLVEKEEGDDLDCLGPLGNGFSIHPATRHLLMVGGGCGIAPLVALSDAAVARGLSVVLLFGARTAGAVYPGGQLPPEVEYGVSTDDGSVGHRGLVTELMRDYLGWADVIYACGPRPMFLSMLDVLRGENVRKPVQVSLEESMSCAVGACFGCVVEARTGEMRTVCEDGPVFEMRDLVWV
jgi:dihydroorotate dehydrogenase electron transfer subunit